MKQEIIKVVVLPGDGIGPEVTREAMRVLDAVTEGSSVEIEWDQRPFGASAHGTHGSVFPEETRAAVLQSDAVLLGAVGDPSADHLPPAERPERGLLELRETLGTWANLRPAVTYPAIQGASPLRAELIEGTDLLVVRELCGGIYFGEPRGESPAVDGHPDGARAFDTMVYTEREIRRIARVAFEQARSRSGRLTSVDKANVLASSRLWRRIVDDVATDYPDVELTHSYVDSCAMALASAPRRFDVLLAGNLFGDILSDIAAVLTGSLGCLPSASVGEGPGLFEPVHGSAPDIAGKGLANPIGAILSGAMLLRHATERHDLADAIEGAVQSALAAGITTADLSEDTSSALSTEAFGKHVASICRRPQRAEVAVPRVSLLP